MTIGTFLWKVQRKIFGQHLGRLFYQNRVDSAGNILPPRLLNGLNQSLMERGWTTPWIMSGRECQEYWKGIANDSRGKTRPVDYAAKPDIMGFIDEFWCPEIGRGHSILQLGCSSGANLQGLFTRGYHRLSGIEINSHAIGQMRASFPEMTSASMIMEGSAEETLRRIPSKGVDVVFTAALLMAIHPTSRAVFSEMVRVAKGYICVLEVEHVSNAYIFARDYKRVFERMGCVEIRSRRIDRTAHPTMDRDFDGYVARLFRCPPA